jgi:hypothetical protein
MDNFFKLMIPVLLVFIIVLGSVSSCKGQLAKIAVEGPTTVAVCREFTVDIWIRELPAPMISFNIRIEWDPDMMEYVRHVSHVVENGWTLLGDGGAPYDPTEPFYYFAAQAEAPPSSQDASWVSITFHCLGSGVSEIRIEESDIEGGAAAIAWEPVNLEVTQVEVAPVGGVASPINKLTILTPYIALAGLIAVVSTVYVIKRRKD